MAVTDLFPGEALSELRADPEIRILDVRTQPEYDSHHLAGALLVPIQDLQSRVHELDPDTRWMVTCEHGIRSAAACGFLAEQGFTDIRNVLGGMARWIGDGLPLDPRAGTS